MEVSYFQDLPSEIAGRCAQALSCSAVPVRASVLRTWRGFMGAVCVALSDHVKPPLARWLTAPENLKPKAGT